MANPSWRVKSRPCPFYSQGRCLFSDSCNFVHEAKVKAKLDPIFQHHRKRTSQQLQSSQLEPGHGNHRRTLSDPSDSPVVQSFALQNKDQNLPDGHSGDSHCTPTYRARHSLDLKSTNPEHAEFEHNENDPPARRGASNEDGQPVAKRASNSSSLGLLSPVFSPPLVTFSKQQPIDPTYRDEDWVGPAPFMVSPPRSPSRLSTLDILTSPFRSPTARLSQFMPFSTSMKRLSFSEDSQGEHLVHTLERRHTSGLLLQMGTPTSSRNSIVFDDSASILTEGLGISPEDSPEDKTAQLAYLDSNQSLEDGDTLHTLYQTYSERSPDAIPPVQRATRPPVFSLPSTRQASPIASSSNLPTVFSAPTSAPSSAGLATPQKAVTEPIPDKSTKVPFGFRNGPNPSRSSLWLKRQSQAQQSGRSTPAQILSPPSPTAHSPVPGGGKLRPLRLSIIVSSNKSVTSIPAHDLFNDTTDQGSRPSSVTTSTVPIPSSSQSLLKNTHRHSLEISGAIIQPQETLESELVPLSAPPTTTSTWHQLGHSDADPSIESRSSSSLASEPLFEEPEEVDDKTVTPQELRRHDIQDQPICLPLRNSPDNASIPHSSPTPTHTPPNRTPFLHVLTDIIPDGPSQDLLTPGPFKDDETISIESDEYHTALDSAPTPQITALAEHDDTELGEVHTVDSQLTVDQEELLETSVTLFEFSDEEASPIDAKATDIPGTISESSLTGMELDAEPAPDPPAVFSPPRSRSNKRFSSIPAVIPVDTPRLRSPRFRGRKNSQRVAMAGAPVSSQLGSQTLPTPPLSAVESTSAAQSEITRGTPTAESSQPGSGEPSKESFSTLPQEPSTISVAASPAKPNSLLQAQQQNGVPIPTPPLTALIPPFQPQERFGGPRVAALPPTPPRPRQSQTTMAENTVTSSVIMPSTSFDSQEMSRVPFPSSIPFPSAQEQEQEQAEVLEESPLVTTSLSSLQPEERLEVLIPSSQPQERIDVSPTIPQPVAPSASPQIQSHKGVDISGILPPIPAPTVSQEQEQSKPRDVNSPLAEAEVPCVPSPSVTPAPASSSSLEPRMEAKVASLTVDTNEDDTEDKTIRPTIPISASVALPRASAQLAPASQASAVFSPPATVLPQLATSFKQPPAPPTPRVETPKPLLAFAIASDDVTEVEKVLKSGEAHANDQVGPQSALDFVLTNDQLDNKLEMVKTLLAFGAKPSKDFNTKDQMELDPATRYHLSRAAADGTKRASKLIQKSFFKPLTRVRYNIIGQDMALEQLFRVLNMHSKQLTISPIVVFLCGPSGHGKSYLAQKFGSLIDISTHIVNMTAIRSTQALWNAYSLVDGHDTSSSTLGEFLTANQGKRCVVVLEEIEKTEDEKSLWSLLMPWESGQCLLEPGGRPIDVRNVIWICTSNLGAQMIFELDQARSNPSKDLTREEYLGYTTQLRTLVSDKLGPSLLSRVTAVLPFVPFSVDERTAIAAEAFLLLGGDVVKETAPAEFEEMVQGVLASYVPTEGARSLYRSVSSYLLDNI